MSEAQNAWRLWQLLRMLVDMLWERYESEFTEFSAEEKRLDNWYYLQSDEDFLPF
jgi:hypothetical protein